MTTREFLNEIEGIIEADPGSLQGVEKLTDLERWDSLAVVGFIAMVDEKFGVTLPAKKIAEAQSTADLVALLGDKIVRS